MIENPYARLISIETQPMNEHLFYHALNIATSTNQKLLTNLYKTNGSWEKTWKFYSENHSCPDPSLAWKSLASHNINLILLQDKEYPKLLSEIPWPPLGIYIRGSLPTKEGPWVSIVGTRKATPQGKTIAEQFAEELAKKNIVIISGLALGIDASAHNGCIIGGMPTVAVLANGVDSVYPKVHANLANRILETGGCIISEYPPSSPTLPYRFLERNRIIAGLGEGTLVIEAPLRSGSIATARFALEQNRDVYVIPGPVLHPNFKGSHSLIRTGAELVTEPIHILEALGVAETETGNKRQVLFSNPETETVFTVLRDSSIPLTVDKIAELTNLKIHIVNQALTLLTIQDVITEGVTGYTIRYNQ